MGKSFDDFWCELDEVHDFDMKNPKYHEEWKGKVYLCPTKKELTFAYTGNVLKGGEGKCSYIKKAHETAQAGNTVVLLLPAHTGASWFQDYILKHFYDIHWIKGTIDDRFEVDNKNKCRTYQNYMIVTMINFKLELKKAEQKAIANLKR